MTAKEMSDYRLPNRLQNHVNGLEVLVMLFMDYLQNLHNCVKSVSETRKKEIEICLHNCVKSVEISLQNLHNCVKSVNDVESKNSENGSKMQFSAISGENSASRGEGGLGGGVLNPSTSNRNNTVTDVTSTIYLKEKNTKKRKENSQKNVKPYSEDFEKFHAVYPNKHGKSKAFEYWEKYKKDGLLPELGYIIATVELFAKSEQWQKEGGSFIPMCKTFVYNRRWEDFEKDKVEGYIKHVVLAKQKEMQILKDKQEKNEHEQKELEERKRRLEKLKTLELPSFESWAKLDLEAKMKILEKLPKGIYLGELNTEIARRAGK